MLVTSRQKIGRFFLRELSYFLLKKLSNQFSHILVRLFLEAKSKDRIDHDTAPILQVLSKLPQSLGIEVVLVESLTLFVVNHTRNQPPIIHQVVGRQKPIFLEILNRTDKTFYPMLYLGIGLAILQHQNSKGTVNKVAILIPLNISELQDLRSNLMKILQFIK